MVMFRSSVAAFYPLPRCLFYGIGRFHCGGFIIVFLRSPPICSEIKKVVHWMSEILFASEIAFRCFGRMHAPARIESAPARHRYWHSFAHVLRKSCGAHLT